jgi:hypothetical protein
MLVPVKRKDVRRRRSAERGRCAALIRECEEMRAYNAALVARIRAIRAALRPLERFVAAPPRGRDTDTLGEYAIACRTTAKSLKAIANADPGEVATRVRRAAQTALFAARWAEQRAQRRR